MLMRLFLLLLHSQDKDAVDKDNKKTFSVPVTFEADVEIKGCVDRASNART